ASAEGIPSVGMSPFACGWSTQRRDLASANASQIIESLHAGFVPVLHGDAVLDESLDCTILSGDVIIRHLAQLLTPKYVVFLMFMEYMTVLQLTQMQYFSKR
uniref:Aspartate/glutamate/uridylate kinase domain-containing protein n=1 Tax=Aegilops tauschii subsp. strangulata TaxID=200361 RepID=A0A453FKR3_AEGTS